MSIINTKYFVRYNGELKDRGCCDDPEGNTAVWEGINPFRRLGYEQGLAVYNDRSKWEIRRVNRTLGIDEKYSFKELIDRSERYVLDMEDGEVESNECIDTKRRIRYGYPICSSHTNDGFKLLMAVKYNRRRVFRRYIGSAAAWYVYDVSMFKDMLKINPVLYIGYACANRRTIYVYYSLQGHIMHDWDSLDWDIAEGYKGVLRPFFLFILPSERTYFLDGLYDGLSAALRAL